MYLTKSVINKLYNVLIFYLGIMHKPYLCHFGCLINPKIKLNIWKLNIVKLSGQFKKHCANIYFFIHTLISKNKYLNVYENNFWIFHFCYCKLYHKQKRCSRWRDILGDFSGNTQQYFIFSHDKMIHCCIQCHMITNHKSVILFFMIIIAWLVHSCDPSRSSEGRIIHGPVCQLLSLNRLVNE